MVKAYSTACPSIPINDGSAILNSSAPTNGHPPVCALSGAGDGTAAGDGPAAEGVPADGDGAAETGSTVPLDSLSFSCSFLASSRCFAAHALRALTSARVALGRWRRRPHSLNLRR
jgi:hypothetical protein